MDIIIFAVALLIIISPILAFLTIRPDGKYYCGEPGCNRSFDSLRNFTGHLENEHHYTEGMIEDILNVIANTR